MDGINCIYFIVKQYVITYNLNIKWPNCKLPNLIHKRGNLCGYFTT